jgi:hypothetical protein
MARLVSRLLTLVVLVVSGIYLLVYLYRWEWNRALISGLFFLAAEVAFVGSSVRGDIRSLASRLDASEDPRERRLHAELGAADARPARSFAWLRETTRGHAVFVPVLLGAGVILSAAAFVVERLAGVVAHSSLDRDTARRLIDLEPPPHGLVGGHATERLERRRRARSLATTASRAVALTMAAVLSVGAIDLLADATQTRAEVSAQSGTTLVDVSIDQRRGARPAVDAVDALIVACRATLPAGAEVVSVTPDGTAQVEIAVTPQLSEARRRRFFGCLEDATLDLVRARVVRWADSGG